MACCLCCIYFINFVFFRSSPISTHRVTSGKFFFQSLPPRENPRWRLWRQLPLHQLKPFVLAPKLKSTLYVKPSKLSWLKRHHYYWSRILLTMLFLSCIWWPRRRRYLEESTKCKSFLSFLFDYQLWYFASYYLQQIKVKCSMSYFCRCISKTKLFQNWSRFTHNLRKEVCRICHYSHFNS